MQQHLTTNNDITSVYCSTLNNVPNKHDAVFINSYIINFSRNKKQALVCPTQELRNSYSLSKIS